jgi:hypothetical protein
VARYTKQQPSPYAWKKGVSGNPSGLSKAAADLVAAAREHTAAALGRLVQLMEQDEDRDIALSAAAELLNRGWGKPPVAVFAQINGADADGVVRYDIRWADAKTNSFPEENNAPTIDAADIGHGEANGEAEAEAEPMAAFCWGDGTPVK